MKRIYSQTDADQAHIADILICIQRILFTSFLVCVCVCEYVCSSLPPPFSKAIARTEQERRLVAKMARVHRGSCTMGTLFCPVCGFCFPLSTDGMTPVVCTHCNAHCGPLLDSSQDVLSYKLADIAAALKIVERQAKMDSGHQLEHTDNRVMEEAYCERCNAHRPCTTFARQTRSADEGQTIFFTCTVCKSEWSSNS